MRDPVEAQLIGQSIWNAAAWIEAHSHGPYEIWTEPGETPEYGYRITVERLDGPVSRIPTAPSFDPAWDKSPDEMTRIQALPNRSRLT